MLYPGACPFRKRVCGAGRDDYLQVIENNKAAKVECLCREGVAEPAKRQYWKVKLTIGISI